MKKIIFLMSCIVISTGIATAQEPKPEKKYTPEAGEFSIGFDASPIFNYIGNLLNSSEQNNFGGFAGKPFTAGNDLYDPDIMPDVSIMAKYMVTDNFAIKANLGLKVIGANVLQYATDDAALLKDPLSEAKVVDRYHYSCGGFSLLIGGEYRIGKKRVQGVFGGGLLLALQNNSYSYKFGNAITEINQHPSTGNYAEWIGDYRTTKANTDGFNTSIGLSASAGVEWFVAPKVSLGAEVSLAAYYMFGAKSYRESEGYNPALSKVETRTDLLSPGTNVFCLGTESLGGALYISFWF